MDGSLYNILCNVGVINEYCLKYIAKSVLKALDFIHNKLNTNHGYVRPHQILYDKKGKIKLSIGISSKLSNEYRNSAIGLSQCPQGALFDGGVSNELFRLYNKYLNLNNQKNTNKMKSIDIYDLGICLLQAISGSNSLLLDNFTNFFEE